MGTNRIFLSHKSTDKPVVREYRDALRAMGLRPWMDESDIPLGPALDRTLRAAMESSCAAVFFVTKSYEDAGYLTAEIDDALQQKTARGDGFTIITLLLPGSGGTRASVPEPLQRYVWGTPDSHLHGLRQIIEALPPHITNKACGHTPLPTIIPPATRQVAVVGQNLCTIAWLGLPLDETRYSRFKDELHRVLRFPQLHTFVLMMMTPKALHAIHPQAAAHMRSYSLTGLRRLRDDLRTEQRISIVFHPAATLSMLAIDWSHPDEAFALITPKFQTTSEIDKRMSVLLEGDRFDAATLSRMLLDSSDPKHPSAAATVLNAPEVLESLIRSAEHDECRP